MSMIPTEFKPKTKVIAFLRGHPDFLVPLRYLYTVPYVLPKKDLTASPTEKTDTRMLGVVCALAGLLLSGETFPFRMVW